MFGFETIGNATLIVYDGSPVLVTDPWISGDAYFGSWGLSHEIPAAQRDAIRRCRYCWLSHAHPDHSSIDSLASLGSMEILLGDHRGGRLKNDLTSMGFTVRVLPEREWVSLSSRIKVMTISDYNQDSLLLVDLDGALILNLNDGSALGSGRFLRSVARQFETVFLMRLWGEGAADMTNVFDEAGERIAKPWDFDHSTISHWIQSDARRFCASHAVPFSSFHRFQREDSVWANELITPLTAFHQGADPAGPEILRPFIRYNRTTGEATEIKPRDLSRTVRTALECGDNWSDPLEADEQADLRRYFQSKEMLRDHIRYLTFRVGGVETMVDINSANRGGVGVTFEAPRQSLMAAVRYRVFDDMMIGNFMRTTLHGTDNRTYLNRTFTPVVCKYADNGGAESKDELQRYMDHYYARDRVGHLMMHLETHSESLFRKFVKHDSLIHRSAKHLYWALRH